MAPKQYTQIDDLPAASSDDEIDEQEEDSSDQEQQQHEESMPQKTDPEQDEDKSEESDDETEEEQEEDSSNEEKQQQPEQDEYESEESNDEEEEPVLHKHSVQKYPSPLRSEQSEGSDSDSDSDGTQNSPTAYAVTIKPIASKPMEISPKFKKPISKSIQLKQPSTKRPIETEQNGSGSMNKKSRVSNGDGENVPGKKSTLNRLWSEDAEIVILKGMIDYQTEKVADPYSDMAAFHEFVKDSLSVDVSKSQLTEKIRRLKKKYQNNAEKGENGDDPVFSKSHEHKTFELSKKIWGGRVKINGVDGSKVKSSKRKDKKDEKVVHNTVPKLMENTKEEGMESWSMYPRLSESLESETSVYLSLPKDVKNFVKERISLLGREKMSQLEEKWKDIRVMECNLFAKRLELIHDQTQMVLNEMKPSKS